MDARVKPTAVRLSIGKLELAWGVWLLRWRLWRIEDVGERSSGEEHIRHQSGERLQSQAGVVAEAGQSDQQIGDQRGHALNDDGVLAGAEEVGELEVLLEPLEEQQIGRASCRDRVGQYG